MRFEIVAIGEIDPDFLSSRIQKGIGADYSHVGILVDDRLLWHATGKGFHCSQIQDELKGSVIRRRVGIPVFDESFARGWLNGRKGTRYSNLQYLGFIFPFLRFLPFVDNGRKEVVCSEIAADFIVDCAIVHNDRLADTDWIDPKECMDIAAELFGERDAKVSLAPEFKNQLRNP